jgi:uncharacterized protein YgbK (DUF1537 family)
MLKIGVIADDFTGATDIASFLVKNGLSTIQLTAVDETLKAPENVEAIVISGKTRSCEVNLAIEESLRALRWLQSQGCERFYFKYCSTFDSTAKGNIGPITDALMQELGVDFTILSPALPVNGRTVYKGYLFVNDGLLSESGMRHHPITPMTDSNLTRLMQMQSQGKCAVIDVNVLKRSPEDILAYAAKLKAQGFSYAAVDAIDEDDLIKQGQAFCNYKLVTGGSGLAIGLAQALRDNQDNLAMEAGRPQGKYAVALSGSCSVMTNKQVATYKAKASALEADVSGILEGRADESIKKAVDFVLAHKDEPLAPLIYATADPDKLHDIQKRFGVAKSSHAVEQFFAKVAIALKQAGFERFIVAGGETSGIVTKSLEVKGFYIGPSVAPGVPWVRAINTPISLVLKSGNFGNEDFFAVAQKEY